MELGPIWRAILRNKSSYILIALQIAVTMALMVNAIAIIQERTRLMGRPSGVDEDNIFYVNSTSFDPDMNFQALVAEDLESLRSHPDIVNAVMTNTIPLQGGGWSQEFQTEPGEDKDAYGTAMYFVDEQGVDTFDLRLVAGRNFTSTEINWFDPESDERWPPIAIITAALANKMFPDTPLDQVVGKVVYVNSADPVTVVGIVERMQAAWKSWSDVENATLVPQKRGSTSARYVIRTEHGRRDAVIPEIEKMLAEGSQKRIIRGTTTMTEVRENAYNEDVAMIRLLVFIVSLLTGITALGIVGLASFSVTRRTKQIGTRRALGATRPAILRYFLLENFLISSVGVVTGAVLAVGLNLWMVQTFNLTPLAWYMIPVAMLILWLVGQIAVLGPAQWASRVSPAIATRTI